MPTFIPYNLTGITNYTTGSGAMLSLVRETNLLLGYWIGTGLLITIYLVLFFALRLRGTHPLVGFAACNWVNMVLAFALYPIGLVTSGVFIISIVLVPISMMMLYFIKPD